MRTPTHLVTVAVCVFVAAVIPAIANAVSDYANAEFNPIYTSEPIGVDRLVSEYAFQQPPDWVPPPNKTWYYVRGMGDPGTDELLNQVANLVDWDASVYTGFRPEGTELAQAQRGYRNLGPPIGTNAFQVQGHHAGFLINTHGFSHTLPTTTPWGEEDGGPHIAYERRFSPEKEIFSDPSSELTLQTYFKLPWLFFGQNTAVAQAILFYYLVDITSGFRFAGVMQFFDSRPWGQFNGFERLRSDSQDYYVSTPLSDRTFDELVPRYATRSPYSQSIQNGVTWSSDKFFRAHVSYENMLNIIEDIARQPGVFGISNDPQDWRLLRAGVLVEIGFPNPETMGEMNISVGGSLHHFEIYEARDP